eukprot:scaffold265283_cov30-Tisochrysis_lutea.AAC.1
MLALSLLPLSLLLGGPRCPETGRARVVARLPWEKVEPDGPSPPPPTLFGGFKLAQTGGEKAEEDTRDIPEKLFNFFLGAVETGEVAGLQRTASAPDTYPATKTEFAEPVEGDGEEEAALRPMLKNTNLEFLQLRKVYDSERDGWTAEAWHQCVNYQGPCIVVCETKGGAVCGGYAPKGFAGYGEYRGSIAAFLFTWPSGRRGGQLPIKLQKIGGAGLATIDEPEIGPRFGADGLAIDLARGRERLARSKLGPYYEVMPDGTRHIFAAGEDARGTELVSMRTYAGVWPEGERIPFDGAIPFAIE